MEILEVLKKISGRQRELYQGDGIVFQMMVEQDGIAFRFSWADDKGKTFHVSKIVSYTEMENARYLDSFLNDTVDREVESFRKAKAELVSEDDKTSRNAVGGGRWSSDVPLWRRGIGYTDCGSF